MINKENQQEVIIARLKNILRGQAMYIKEDNALTIKEQNAQLDVILNIAEFIQNYDYNVSAWKYGCEIKQQEDNYR